LRLDARRRFVLCGAALEALAHGPLPAPARDGEGQHKLAQQHRVRGCTCQGRAGVWRVHPGHTSSNTLFQSIAWLGWRVWMNLILPLPSAALPMTTVVRWAVFMSAQWMP
jgi:hypothetical protein